MARILCIDDEPIIRMSTRDYLMDMGHEVFEAASGAEGIALFRRQRPDIVFSDLRMPGGDGFLVVAHMAEEAPETPVVIISGTGSLDEAVKTLRLGAWDYLTKPLHDMDLLGQTVQRMLTKASERRDANQYLLSLESRTYTLERELHDWINGHQDTVLRLEAALKTSISSLNLALREKDPYTAGHNERVASIAVDIGNAMGLGDKAQDTLMLAGRLHDIGKIGVPQNILNKRSFLNPDEIVQIRSHVTGGYRILGEIPFEGPVAEAVLQHHERYDGTGYPDGLAGESILLEARILAVADVYEALCSDRPYRAGLGQNDAADYIFKNAGKHFCPQCVDAFKLVISRSKA
ncbi:MAG TPA: HD domain-containing phosphohydrolase [Humidesulfovibrio sp.]|uniref:HD domain-containing phosphohydrolase n=1 Tax=Humidesulfovibrio sp. TaxID=2910988 RepID=UPI002BA0DF5D|nr:HD domain-containing phosphohydrolase [Humidesulfovibrio sp.]HWR03803.1 HD domain-containing phosphohydrolase [Humidesulfovibrio sp.]